MHAPRQQQPGQQLESQTLAESTSDPDRFA